MRTRDRTTWILKTKYQVREELSVRGGVSPAPPARYDPPPRRVECGEKGLALRNCRLGREGKRWDKRKELAQK